MIAQEKIETFKEELQLIDNEKVRNNVIHILSVTDDYFYHIPASSTGKDDVINTSEFFKTISAKIKMNRIEYIAKHGIPNNNVM